MTVLTRVSVLALIGPAQAGKTTVALELQTRYGYRRFRFADTLKRMIEVLGCSRAHIDGNLKEQPLDILCGKTTRHAMQTLGTEWRNMIGKDLWAVQTATAINEAANKIEPGVDFHVVVDDLRFPHEIDALLDWGFDVTVIKVWDSRKKYPWSRMWLARRAWGRKLMQLVAPLYLHESEAWWDAIHAHEVIDNKGTLAELYGRISEIAYKYGPAKDAIVQPRVLFTAARESR